MAVILDGIDHLAMKTEDDKDEPFLFEDSDDFEDDDEGGGD